jgi:cytochrome c-type biogenesis protein
MMLGVGSVGLGFLAGVLSVLSPCVLPLLPVVLAPATTVHRLGLPALALGLVTSFVGVGLFVATLGFSIGLDDDVFRNASAVLLAAVGIVLLSEALQQRFAIAAGGVSNAGNRLASWVSSSGIAGQFILGLLLGAIWSPCVGPTLGAASLLAAQSRDLPSVAAVMIAFGLGAAVPLLAIGALSRRAFGSWRGRLATTGKIGKPFLGGSAVMVAVLILTGADRSLEAAVVAASPSWLTDLTTWF